MKNNAIIRICIYSLLLVLLIALLLGGLNSFSPLRRFVEGGPNSHAEYSPQRVGDGFSNVTSFAASGVSDLEIDWASGDILIQKADIDVIDIQETSSSSGKPLHVTLKNGTLKIEFHKPEHAWFSLSGLPSKDLTVTVPQNFELRELDLDVASSKVTVLNMTVGNVEFDGADGELDLESCTLRDLDIDAASGKVLFSGSLDTLDMDGASADFEGIFTNAPARLTIDGMSGSLDVALPKDTGFTANIDGMSCNFTSDLPVTSKNGAYISGDGAVKIDADGMSVDVTVRYGE